jgi:hypothetical protein
MKRFAAKTVLASLMILGLALATLASVGSSLAASPSKQGKIAAAKQTPPPAAEEAAPVLPDLMNLGKAVGPWSGFYVGAYGGWARGELDVSHGGETVWSGHEDGWLALGAVGFNIQTGRIVFGPEVSYGWFFGDLNDAGIDNILNVGGRAGILAGNDLLFYAHGSWSRLYTSVPGYGQVDGWQAGPGLEFKIPGSKLSFDVRYAYGQWDVDHECLDIDATSHTFLAGLKLSF